MNTAIYTDPSRQSNIGIGFATPINTLRDLVPQLRTGKVTRGVIGVRGQHDLQPPDRRSHGREERRRRAGDDGPAAGPASRAGIKPGDVIVEFNGRPVQTTSRSSRWSWRRSRERPCRSPSSATSSAEP